MAMVNYSGLMVPSTKENSSMVKSTAEVYSNGQMGNHLEANGRTAR
eukprot:CAMPEP_0114584552 /NCGR_PEP_ID=MMETSP0125-20121206/8230_1 /TAXON_ID=485358 ORGANISM="Aristerostoma sp., Strain ATCC 50986" /NCGR_SAMPLE_ID=MMETSP0125 /ASSEMBLY_ACC=CAM_ASM_000245 /LENGTH=45 /DNA_ID= /DNA_START= /DNA_END= /DNA_ORIENTATION=